MALTSRKVLVVGVVAVVLLLANAYAIVDWLAEQGVVAWANAMRQEYLSGTALTIIVVLLFLLGAAGPSAAAAWVHRCRVCERVHVGAGKFCPICGSRA